MNLPCLIQDNAPYVVGFRENDKNYYYCSEGTLEAARHDADCMMKRGMKPFIAHIEVIKRNNL